jgi:hypothetical protein
MSDTDPQRKPYERIPIGGRVCFAIATTVFYDCGSIERGDYGKRVNSIHPGIYIQWDNIPGVSYLVRRRQLHYPINTNGK